MQAREMEFVREGAPCRVEGYAHPDMEELKMVKLSMAEWIL